MNQLSFGNINILSLPNVININNAIIDLNKLTINTDIKNISFIENWMQIVSNPKMPFNAVEYTCDVEIKIDDNIYYFKKVWPCYVLNLGSFCVIEFIFNSYSFDDNITYKPCIKKQNRKELEKIEFNKIMDELDSWLKNPEKVWEERLAGGIK